MTINPLWPHTIVILTGGQSRRMGFAKHELLRPDGTSLIELALDCATRAGKEVIVAGPEAVLPELKHVIDDGGGPLAGIVATLESGIDEQYLFMPCDMPALTPELLLQLAHGLGDHDAAILRNPRSRKQAMLPLALQARTLPRARAAAEGTKRSIYSFLANIDSIDLRITDDEASRMLNINHPVDWDNYLATLGD